MLKYHCVADRDYHIIYTSLSGQFRIASTIQKSVKKKRKTLRQKQNLLDNSINAIVID